MIVLLELFSMYCTGLFLCRLTLHFHIIRYIFHSNVNIPRNVPTIIYILENVPNIAIIMKNEQNNVDRRKKFLQKIYFSPFL